MRGLVLARSRCCTARAALPRHANVLSALGFIVLLTINVFFHCCHWVVPAHGAFSRAAAARARTAAMAEDRQRDQQYEYRAVSSPQEEEKKKEKRKGKREEREKK